MCKFQANPLNTRHPIISTYTETMLTRQFVPSVWDDRRWGTSRALLAVLFSTVTNFSSDVADCYHSDFIKKCRNQTATYLVISGHKGVVKSVWDGRRWGYLPGLTGGFTKSWNKHTTLLAIDHKRGLFASKHRYRILTGASFTKGDSLILQSAVTQCLLLCLCRPVHIGLSMHINPCRPEIQPPPDQDSVAPTNTEHRCLIK